MKKQFILFAGITSILVSSVSQAQSQGTAKSKSPLIELFADDTYQLTGVAATAGGRLFVNYPYWLPEHKYSVVEVKNGKAQPFPDAAWNSFKKGEDGQNKFVCVQAVVTDDRNQLWIVDAAGIGLSQVYKKSNKVVLVDLKTNKIKRIYRFPESVTNIDTYINDIQVDNKLGYAYMSSSSNGGIVVLNTRTGEARFVLHGNPVTISDPNYHINIAGNKLAKPDGSLAKVNSDGIALTPDKKWLYFKPLTDDKLYRVQTADLRNKSLSADELGKKVQDLGHFITSDGMIMDKKGNLYLGDLEQSAMVKITPDLKMHVIVKDADKLIWPDSYSIPGDGYLYISSSSIQTMPWFNNNKSVRKFPYRIFKLKID